MPKRVDDAVKKRAKALFMNEWSLRDIAAEVLPNSSGGYVTVFRWSKTEGWNEEREELRRQQQDVDHERYLDVVAEIKDRHIRIAQKAVQAVEMTLDAYFDKDEGGNIRGIKLNRWGLPAIPAVALVQLLSVATELERKTVGMDALDQADTEKVAVIDQNVVDADLAKQFGDWLAQQQLSAPVVDADHADDA